MYNNRNINIILYASDKVLLAVSEDELQIMAHQLNITASKYKMKISVTRTKSMSVCSNSIQRVKVA
jgi:hypothetical protein